MIGRTNVGGGGGGGGGFAAIAVTYPEGSICTCSKDGKVLRAKDTSGSFLFGVKDGGTWTITATDGEKTATNTVEVEQNGAYTVRLNYEFVIFPNENTANEFAFYDGAAGRHAIYDDRIYLYTSGSNGRRSAAYYKTQFEPGKYSKLRGHVVLSNAPGSYENFIGVCSRLAETSAPIESGIMLARASSKYSGTFDWEVDISNVTVPFYVVATMGDANMSIYSLWLE